jgi:hypothetical protein
MGVDGQRQASADFVDGCGKKKISYHQGSNPETSSP